MTAADGVLDGDRDTGTPTGEDGGTDGPPGATPATDEQVEAFLAQVPLFTGLPEHARRALAQSSRWLHLTSGAYLFHQGDAADALAIVWSGRLQVIDEAVDAETGARVSQVISLLGRGSWVGELSLLTGAPRSASTRALRDSQLLIVPAAAFDRVLEREPELGVAVARVLAAQLQKQAKAPAPPTEPDTIAIIPLGEELPMTALVERLRHVLSSLSAVTVLDAPPDGTGAPPAPRADGALPDGAFDLPDDARTRAWCDHLDRLETEHPWVILVAPRPTDDPAWAAFCVRSADRTLALVRGGTPPVWALDLLGGARCDLVFVGSSLSSSRMTPSMTALRPRTHHHLREGSAFEVTADRLARRVSGHSLGVVFSGGGARGLAHLGVIEGLVAADVPIDRVGGCSAGAFAAALYAMGHSTAAMRSICREELVEHHPFSDFGVPRDGLIKGKRAMAMLTRVFGDVRIEELSLSMFAVSADLATGELVVHRSGLVRDAIAASMAIPGIAPPIRAEGHLLVDGGILDNFPVDVMIEMDEGPVIGADVMREFPMPDVPTTAGGFRLRDVVGPGIVSTLARSMVLGGWQRAQQNRKRADLLISPAVDTIGMFDFDRMDEAIAAGRRATDAALAHGLPGSPGR